MCPGHSQTKSSEGPLTTSQAPCGGGPLGGVAKSRSARALPAVHSDWVVARLLLLLLHSRDDVDHALPIPRDPNFWPAVKMKLPNLPALVLLVEEHSLRSVTRWETRAKKPTSSGLGENHPPRNAVGSWRGGVPGAWSRAGREERGAGGRLAAGLRDKAEGGQAWLGGNRVEGLDEKRSAAREPSGVGGKCRDYEGWTLLWDEGERMELVMPEGKFSTCKRNHKAP